MPTSVGDPAAGQRLNIQSLPKDAEIRINDGQNQLTVCPCPTSLHTSASDPIELPRVSQIEGERTLVCLSGRRIR